MTLAPEMTTPADHRKLAAAGVVVSAGHTNATYARDAAPRCEHGLTRLHAPVQRDVAAHGPRARRRRRRARRPGQLVRHHRRRPARRPGGAAHRAALQAPRPLHAGHRRDAERRRRRRNRSSLQGRPITVADGVLRRRGRHARRLRHRHGVDGAQRRSAARRSTCRKAARMASRYPAEFLGLGARARAHRARLPREPRAGGRASSRSRRPGSTESRPADDRLPRRGRAANQR